MTNNHQTANPNHGQGQGVQADAQKVADHLGAQIGQYAVQVASLNAVLAEKDEHIAQLQKMLRERQEAGANGQRVTTTDRAVAVGDGE